jgi:hypothetical protein
MNSQTLSIRLAHFQAAVRTVGLIALCVAALIVAIAQQSSVAAETSSAKVSLALGRIQPLDSDAPRHPPSHPHQMPRDLRNRLAIQ